MVHRPIETTIVQIYRKQKRTERVPLGNSLRPFWDGKNVTVSKVEIVTWSQIASSEISLRQQEQQHQFLHSQQSLDIGKNATENDVQRRESSEASGGCSEIIM